MKKTFVILAALFALVAVQSFAADADSNKVVSLQNGGKLIHFHKVVGGTNTVYSSTFSFDGYLFDYDTMYHNVPSVSFSQDTIDRNNGTEVAYTKIILQGTNVENPASGDWAAWDTLSAAINDTTTMLASESSFNLNNKKYIWGRWAVTGIGTNTAALPKIDIYLWRKNY